MQCDLRQVTTIEVMEALNSLLHRSRGPDRKNIAPGEIAQLVAEKRGADPMVGSSSLLMLQQQIVNGYFLLADHASNLCLLCFVLLIYQERLTLGASIDAAAVQRL